jgi:hypothetical protein
MKEMWLSAFCAALVMSGFGCADQDVAAPDVQAPISVRAEVRGKGQAGVIIVTVRTEESGPSAQIDLTLPEGVRLVAGKAKTEAEFEKDKPREFRYAVKADKAGVYMFSVRVMAGEESYRFGKSVSVAWIAQEPD